MSPPDVGYLLIDGTWIEYPVMGAMQFRDGKIVAWRDDCDLAQCTEQTHRHPRPVSLQFGC